MIRTLVALDDDDKAWLDQQAAERGVAMTELVRQAVRLLRAQQQQPTLDELLSQTAGTGTGEDGLQLQDRLREGWHGRTA